MPSEPQSAKQARFHHIVARLDAAMPEAKIELNFSTPLELLVAVMLSAQCTDQRVNMATPELFRRFKTAQDYADATPDVVEPYVKTLGLFRAKAKNICAMGAELVRAFNGQVPTRRDQLVRLPGVGAKTAGVVSMHLDGDRAFPVDTHVQRLAARMDLSKKKTPDEIEAELSKLLPSALWFKGHQLLIWHGRRVCHARAPECHRCVVADVCPKKGVPKKKTGKDAPTARRRPTRAASRSSGQP